MSAYLDTSALVPVFIVERQTAAMVAWLDTLDDDPVVADLVIAEFRSQIARRVRMAELDPAKADEINGTFDRWREEVSLPLENLPVDIRGAVHLVRIPFPKLLTPDAIHIATCRRLGHTLVTYDRRMIEAATREKVATYSPA